MTSRPQPQPAAGEPAGCLRATAGIAALAVLAPFALAIRSLRAWRRGSDVRIEREVAAIEGDRGGAFARIDTLADVPAGAVEAFQRRLTDTVVRIAEALRRHDDVYHVMYRDRAADETVVLPVGPLLQELGERFHLILTEGAMAGRSVAWMTLPRGRRLVELVDPFEYDPEDPGEPERLLRGSGASWSMATAFIPRGSAVLYRLVLYVPPESAGKVAKVLDRLSN